MLEEIKTCIFYFPTKLQKIQRDSKDIISKYIDLPAIILSLGQGGKEGGRWL